MFYKVELVTRKKKLCKHFRVSNSKFTLSFCVTQFRYSRIPNLIFPWLNKFKIALRKGAVKWLKDKYSFKVAPRAEKIEKLKFCKSDLFCELYNKKTLFSIMDERNSVFFLFLQWNYFLPSWAIWLLSQP